MSTIDAAAITALGRRITDLAAEVGVHSRALAALVPAEQWQSPASGRFQLHLQPTATALGAVADQLTHAASALVAHLRVAQQREQEVRAAAGEVLRSAEHAAAGVADSVLSGLGLGSGTGR